MDCIAYLSKLLANFVYLQYKFHHIHTDMAHSPIFMPMHLLMNDIYQFFGDDNIDRIKERVRILWGNTPASIFELSQLTDIQELESVPQMMWLLEIVASDLRTIEDFLSAGINTTGDKWDLVTQNQMINFADAVWTFRWKIEMSIPKKEEWKPLSPIKK